MIDRQQLVGALGRLIVLTSEKSQSVKITFTDNHVLLNVDSPDKGKAKEEITVVGTSRPADARERSKAGDKDGIEGALLGPLTVSVNPDFLLDLANAWTDEKITIAIKDDISPILGTAGAKVAVIMPMRQS